MSNRRFIDLGLPELPLNTNREIEPDLRYLYMAVQTLAQAIGQQTGLETPLEGYQNLASAATTLGKDKKRLYVTTSEPITFGQIVNLWDNAGAMQARLANATDATKPGIGICNTPGTSAAGITIEVVVPSCHIGSIGGLTPGTVYYLSTVAGTVQNAPPAVAGNIVQPVGIAIGATDLYFHMPYLWRVV